MTARKTNPFGKSATKQKPYAVYRSSHGWTWAVLKTYKRPDKEAGDQYARWFTFVTFHFARRASGVTPTQRT